jgi:SAM-dependent methyltransferase
MDTYTHNQQAWDDAVAQGNEWTLPSTPEQIERARRGDWRVLLTPETAVPHAWFGTLNGLLSGKSLLGLACGGGQQGPIFAAAGAQVTIFDASAAQLAQDRAVAAREGLRIETLQGNMKDLSALPSDHFDIVFNPCSVCFVDDVRPVWLEAARVLKPGGALLTGFVNPWFYLFDMDAFDAGRLEVARQLPHRDIDSRWGERLQAAGDMLEFSHTFEDLIGGQLAAGLMLTHLFEDGWKSWEPLNSHAKALIATRAIKPL